MTYGTAPFQNLKLFSIDYYFSLDYIWISVEVYPATGASPVGDGKQTVYSNQTLKENVMKKTVFIFFLLFLYASASAEIGVIPFRVENPSVNFKSEEGIDYARLLSVAALLKKDVDLHSPEQLYLDMKRNNLNYTGTITTADLNKLGRPLHLNQIILGTLYRSGGKYISETMLYSVREDRILFRNKNSASTLYKLAEADINDLFTLYPDKRKTEQSGAPEADIAILMDLSYNSISDWDSIKDAVISFSSKLIDSHGINTRIYVVPFSERVSPDRTSVSDNSISSLRNTLDRMNPSGPPSAGQFRKAFNYAVNNLRWRSDADKSIIIMSASPVNEAAGTAVTAERASRRGIKVHAVKYGSLNSDTASVIDALTRFSSGISVFVSYNRSVYGPEGNEYNLYYQGGRIFETISHNGEWRNGILETSGGERFRRPRKGFDEILQGEPGVTPRNMAERYDRKYSKRLIREGDTRLNMRDILITEITDKVVPERPERGRPLARVLISDGKGSFWVSVMDESELDFFEKRSGNKFYFPLGVSFRKDSAEAHGLSLNVEAYDIESGFIPGYMAKELGEILQNPESYLKDGLFYPPVWFVDVRVEAVRKRGDMRDIRN